MGRADEQSKERKRDGGIEQKTDGVKEREKERHK